MSGGETDGGEVTWPGPPRPALSVSGPFDEIVVWREPDGTWRSVILPGDCSGLDGTLLQPGQ